MQSIATFQNTKHDPAMLGQATESPPRTQVRAQRIYKGALVGESVGDLLVCQTSEKDFGYVGMDLFKGALDGHSGTFVYQHGELHAGGNVKPFGFIVSGSGTGALKGIEGDVSITVTTEGVHAITLDWEFGKTS